MSDILLAIGKKIKEHRVEKKFSTNRVSLDLRLSIKYLDRIEDGSLDEELEINNVIRYLKLYLDYFQMDSVSIISDYRYKISAQFQKEEKHNVVTDSLIISNRNYIGTSLIMLCGFLLFLFYLEFVQVNHFTSFLSDDKKILLRN